MARTSMRLLTGISALALVVIACGGDAATTTTSSTAAVSSSAAPASSVPATTASSTVAPTTATTTTTTEPPTTTTQAPSTTTSTTVAGPEVITISITVADGEVSGPGRVTVQRGAQIRLTVISDEKDEVHFHGYDVYADVAPGAPAMIILIADIPGVFEIELEGRGLELTIVEVQ